MNPARLRTCGIIVLLLVMALPVYAEPTVTISNYTVTPQVLMPGDLGTITVQVKNTAQSASISESLGSVKGIIETVKTTDINVFIEQAGLEGNGIVVLGDTFQRIGDLGPGQTIPLTFLIRAPAKTGLYFPEVWIDTYGGRSTRYPVPVNVNTQIAVPKLAVISMAVTTPTAIKPGDPVPVRLDLENTGESMAEQVIVRLGNASTSVTPTESGLYHIKRIASGESVPLDITLITDRTTTPGIVRVPVTIEYYTIDGILHTENSAINLHILGKAEISVASVETSPERVVAGEPFNLIIRVENAGTGDAKSVGATIDMPVSGTREAFLGKIKPGNDAPALFQLNGAPAGDLQYTVNISYSDDWGDHTEKIPLTLPVTRADFTIVAAGILILCGLAFAAWWIFIWKKPGRDYG
ncbi:MAG TPA: S-layer protein [Methanoregula sp.]|nr:S-layer protein [Methanoregula sp.]